MTHIATKSRAGLMAPAHVKKLDEVESLSPVKSVNSKTGDVVLDYSDVGAAASNHSHANATTSADGFMSATDKSKLDGIQSGAQVNAVTSVAGKTGAVTLSNSDISGLGNSATRNVGTTSGTVAAGDDSRITGALQRSGGTMTGALTLSGNPTSNLHAATKQYVDNAISNNTGIGVGQSWYSASRNIGTSYQNTRGRPIEIIVSLSPTSNESVTLEVSQNNSSWIEFASRSYSSGSTYLSFILPNEWYYRVTKDGSGTLTTYSIKELR